MNSTLDPNPRSGILPLRSKRAGIVAWIASCLTLASVLRASEPGAIAAFGGDEILWVYRNLSSEDADPLWRFAFCVTDRRGKDRWWRPWELSDVTGDIRTAAVAGERFHVWYADGTHRFYERRRSGIARVLPEAAIPIAVAGDRKTGILHAIVPRSVALAMQDDGVERSPDPEAENARTPTDAPSDTGATLNEEQSDTPATLGHKPSDKTVTLDDDTSDKKVTLDGDRWPDAHYVVARLERAEWRAARAVPPWFDPPGDVWLIAVDASLTLLWSDGKGGTLSSFTRHDSGGTGWSNPAPIPTLSPADVMSVQVLDGAPLIVTSRDDGAETLRLEDGRWVPGPAIEWGGRTPAGRDVDAFGLLGSRLFGLRVSDHGTVEAATWDPTTGSLLSDPMLVRALSPNTDAREGNRWRDMISHGLLLAVLMAVVFRRRSSVLDNAALPADFELAGHGRRFLAFAFDATVFYPCVWIAFMPMIRAYDYDSTALLHAASSDSAVMNEFTWRWIAVTCGFITYMSVCESIWSASLGKRVMRLCVVAEDGTRCPVSRIVLRNVLRWVEFYPFFSLTPTLVLILLTKNRQRLGDLMAKTLVVRKLRDDSTP